MQTHDDSIYGGPSVERPCVRCKGEFGQGENCRNCGRHVNRAHLGSGRRRNPIGGKRGRNSGTTKTSKNK